MGHTHIKTIKIHFSCGHYKRQDKKITDPVSPWILLQTTQRTLLKAIKNGNFLTCPGLNNQSLLKHVPPSIATELGNMEQERKKLQLKKQVKSKLELE